MSKGRSKSKPKHVSGFVSILGRPNAGKSPLLNAFLGTKLAIVADKPQTTRTTVQGVWTKPGAQVIFVDTPGIHAADSLINRRMMQTISEALKDRDLLLYLIDVSSQPTESDEKALELVKKAGAPTIAVFNKVDRLSHKAHLLPIIEQYTKWHEFDEYLPLSAKTGEGLEELRASILKRMPSGPAYFPEDYITDQPERFMASELIREKILSSTRQEVPHSVAVLVDEWEDKTNVIRIAATIYVERAGQKNIIVGASGAMIKKIGTAARLEMERFFDRKIFLELFVKVKPDWRNQPEFLNELDWRRMVNDRDA